MQSHVPQPHRPPGATAVSPQVFTGEKNVCVVFPQEKPL
jgi:hypothetical protein